LTALVVAATLAGTSGPARAAAADPDGATPAGRSTPITVRSASTEQIREMAAQGDGRLITLGTPAAKGQDPRGAAMPVASVTCYLSAGVPYGGGAANAHIFVDGLLYCDDYVHVAVLTVELYRGLDRVANTTATFPFVSGILATAEYATCNEGVYVGIVGATVARYDLNPPSATATVFGYPIYIGCGSAPPPPPSTS
jgi:hypothetical protein